MATATPITVKDMQKWIDKTWRQCQQRAWAEKPSG